ncbi:hypothetical protein M427DRAFT_60986 [Gonapodya prolifera JEL478]|uniref:DUF7918 domain-containing protein n=1 Tax=Gonapodya prolifera (strain JEL478) TaxID=1344416 RepID=A0A139A3J1_GONPJ|nr:hypothetical protein M427DRAFT_60986 [Gonapodya prolifera JEL478]|eukprot:KXS11188.1 hypothetical protein M427DRAFT_60986 [Gonapodya prolifera JEL478]
MTADASSSNELKIHEKAKKATLISHATGFGKLLPSNAPETRIHTQKLDPWPIATFIFLYRSRALLSVMEGVDLPPEIEPALTQTSGSSQAASSSTPSEPSRKSTGNGGPSTSSKRGRDATPGSASDNISARLPVVVDVDALPDTPNLKRVKMEVKVEGGTSRPAAGYVVDLTGDD